MTGLTFLSWARGGPQLDASNEDPLTGPLAGHGSLTLGVRVNERPEVTVRARLYGPGDVTGLDGRQIIRCDPAPEADAAEPTFFPLVEFDRPDLPWLLTPARARGGEQLRPWLVLVVAEAPPAGVAPEPNAVLPVLRCRRGELPDLADSWAWAHAQLATDGVLTASVLDDLLLGPPERSLSRLMCPRRLHAGRRYLAAVVPAFDAGRKRGLGLPVSPAEEGTLQPAWTAGDGDEEITLPVYHHWRFATGPEGDFRSLVGRLRARPMPSTVGLRPLDVSSPAHGLPVIDPADPAAVLGLEGALRGPTTAPSTWDSGAAAEFAAGLAPLLARRPGQLGPPLYGSGPAGVDEVSAAPRWMRELNLDPRYRAAAGFGAEVIRREQEALMASAWAQAAAIARANETLRQGQFARTAALRGYARRLTGDSGLDIPHLLQISGPAHDALGMRPLLEPNAEVQAALSPAFRRATRPRSPLTRRMTTATALLAPPVEPLGNRSLTVNPALRPAGGMVALETLTGGDRVRDIVPTRVRAPWWVDGPTVAGERPAPMSPRLVHTGAPMPNRLFMVTDDGRVLSRVDNPPAWHDHGRPPSGVAVDQPVAVRDLHAFVRTLDGRLCSLSWDGDRWAWQDHGQPSGGPVEGRPFPRSIPSVATPYSVCVCAGGRVWERLAIQGGDIWRDWLDLGSPPGTAAVGAIGGADHNLLVHGQDGRLLRLERSGGNIIWTDLGSPGAVVDTSTGAVMDGDLPVVLLADGRLFTGTRFIIIGSFWFDYGAPERVTQLLGVDNGLWAANSATGKLFRARTDSGNRTWDSYEPINGLGGAAVLRGGEPWVAADGKLAVLRSAPPRWETLGAPEPPGSGDPAAPPPRQPAWRGTVGFMSNLLVAHLDNPAGGSGAQLRFGHDLGFEGEVHAEWEIAAPALTGTGFAPQGGGLAVGKLDDSGDDHVALFWVDAHSAPGTVGSWRTGRSSGGAITWNPPDQDRRMPTPISTVYGSTGALTESRPIRGCDITLGDLDGDGRAELVVAYVSGVRGGERLYYRIGWGLAPSGDVTGGWTESIEVPWDDRGSDRPPWVYGVGVALGDLENDLRPELVVLLIEDIGGEPRARYMIGWKINGRGQVVGGWSGPHPVGGGPFGPETRGAAIALADFSGTQSPDLVVFHVESGPTGTRAFYRIGFDLGASGLPRRWSEDREIHPGAWPTTETMAAGVAVSDLTDDLLDAKRTYANDFWTAAVAHQTMIERGQRLARADDAVPVEVPAVAAAVKAALDPEQTVTDRVARRLRGFDLANLPPGADKLDPLAVAPSFPVPMSEPLAEMSQDLLLPGVDQVPADTMTLVRANTTFIEAYLVGLNHEFARELLWREFPADKGGTYFRQFWDARGGDPVEGSLTDIPPIATWGEGDQGLGAHATAVGGPDMVVLLIRGELLRRYPNAHVYARRAEWGAAPEPAVPRALGTETLSPQFQGSLPPDLMFFGFPRTVAQARGSATDPGWFFVLAEHPTAPRFGIADPPKDPTDFGVAPGSWGDLDWARLAAGKDELEAIRHAPVATPFGSITRPDPPIVGVPELTWPRNSAHLAHITYRRPVEVAVHASDLLPDLGDGWRVSGVSIDAAEPPRTRIRSIGGAHPDGTRWRFTIAETVEAIRRHEQFFVEDPHGVEVDIIVAQTPEGAPYLRTVRDTDEPTVLLGLPELADG